MSEESFEPIECGTCGKKTPPVLIRETKKEKIYSCLVCKNPFTVEKPQS